MAAGDSDLFRAGKHWVCLATDDGGLARVPRWGSSGLAGNAAGAANSLPVASAVLEDKADPAAPVFLPLAESVTPLSWVETQRLHAIETSRAQRLAATAVTPRARASASASTGERTVRLFVQPGRGERPHTQDAMATLPRP